MNRVFIQLGPLTIYWYSVLILVAVLIGYNIIVNYCKKLGYQTSNIIDMLFSLVIWAIVGARLYYVIFNFSAYEDNLLGIFMLWEGGLAIYGAIIAGVLYIAYYCVKKKLNFIKMLDIFSLSLLLGQAIGRWGNFFNSEAYGGITTYEALKSFMIPEFIIQGMYIDGAYRQPTFLYESLWCLIGVFILMWIRKKYSNIVGKQICFYLIWYGVGRFFIEGLRSDSLYLGDFRISQIVSVIMIVIGIVGSIVIWRKKRIPTSSKVVGGNDGRI
ncbi:MAG: prolipoprotein diacylglyceryl transferase [Bacilli bacterium]|nr:prolipoprotein diacylglyceryl transferase [Bacilli bacterium]